MYSMAWGDARSAGPSPSSSAVGLPLSEVEGHGGWANSTTSELYQSAGVSQERQGQGLSQAPNHRGRERWRVVGLVLGRHTFWVCRPCRGRPTQAPGEEEKRGRVCGSATLVMFGQPRSGPSQSTPTHSAWCFAWRRQLHCTETRRCRGATLLGPTVRGRYQHCPAASRKTRATLLAAHFRARAIGYSSFSATCGLSLRC